MRLYLTADDFGLNTEANQAIATLAKMGRLDCISLLVNMPESASAIKLYASLSTVPIGLHFNLVEGYPCLPKDKVKTLTDKNGRFYSLVPLLFRLKAGLIDTNEIKAELDAQLRVMQQSRLPIAHLNSHQNIHIFTPINAIVKAVASENSIPLIRTVTSIDRRMKAYPIKYPVYTILKWLFGTSSFKTKNFEEISFHPGTKYD